MSEETCRHQREKLLGIPQTGACSHCVPWMFPNRCEPRDVVPVVVTDQEVAFWSSKAKRNSALSHRDPQVIRDNIALGKRIGTYREWTREDCWP